jgi:hypothetical protein
VLSQTRVLPTWYAHIPYGVPEGFLGTGSVPEPPE